MHSNEGLVNRLFSSTLLVVIVAVHLAAFVNAEPREQACGVSSTWVRGNSYNVPQMRITKFSTSTNACRMTISPQSATYNANQTFTVTLTSYDGDLGFKIETVGGATMTPITSKGQLQTPERDCLNYNSAISSASFTVKAPYQGSDIFIRALCGEEKIMYVATEIKMGAGPDVLPPPDPNGASDDPNYAFQTGISSNLVLRHSRNDTHAKFNLEYTGIGYLSLGLGNSMIGSTVLVGVDPASNLGMAGVSLYDITSYDMPVGNLLASGGSLTTYGIVEASYTAITGKSNLKWTMDLASQQTKFTFVKPAGTKQTLIWSLGGGAPFVKHSRYGFFQNFEPGALNAPAPAPSPAPPGSDGGGGQTSSDPDYAFETPLGGGRALLLYKQNDTHLAFKIKLNDIGYVAFGPGTAMVDSTVIIGMDPATNPGQSAVGLYTLKGKAGGAPEVNTNLATTAAAFATYGIVDTSFVSANGVSELKFALELTNQKPEFTLVPPNGLVNCMWAVGGPVYTLHSAFGFLSAVDFATGASSGAAASALDVKLVAHILTMIMAWEIFAPVGVVIPLLNSAKHGLPGMCRISAPTWLKYHWILLTIGVILGYIGTLAGFLYVDGKGSTHWSTPHKNLGFSILFASILQPLWGHLRPAKAKTGETKSYVRVFFEYGHPIFGYVLVLLGIVECLLGIEELERVFGGQDYLFGELQGRTGFNGTLGVVVVILGAGFMFLILAGFYRSGLNNYISGQNKRSRVLGVSDSKLGMGLADRVVTLQELESHSTESSGCWVAYKGKVFDVTEFLTSHPGGKRAILLWAGKDMTTAFNDIGHSSEALSILNGYMIGSLAGGAGGPQDVETGLVNASDPNKLLNGDNTIRHKVALKEKIKLSHNVYMLKFALPSPKMVLGLPIGKHIALFAPNLPGTVPKMWNGKPDSEASKAMIQRKYTPVSCDDKDKGYFTVVIKCYRKDPKFPDGGKMGRFLDGLKVGSTIEVAGPFGGHLYLGSGRFLDSGREFNISQIAMVAGGSGITPIYQIARAMLMDPTDPCKISILYGNSTVDDVLLGSELDELERLHPDRVNVWYTVSQTPQNLVWKYSLGRITKEMLQTRFPPPTKEALVISCGPQPMMDHVAKLLREIGFSDSQRMDY